MTERGRIREIKGNNITIVPDLSDACFGCMKMECKTKGGILSAENPKSLNLEIGQTVELKNEDSSYFRQFVIAILPLFFGFILGFFLTRLIFPNLPEEFAAFVGVINLFLTAFIIYILRKKFPAKEHKRYVERILV